MRNLNLKKASYTILLLFSLRKCFYYFNFDEGIFHGVAPTDFIRESHFTAKSLRMLFQDILPEKIFNFLKEINVFGKI